MASVLQAMRGRQAETDGKPYWFGAPTGPDPVEAGRRGGRASAATRKLRKQRMLEEKILDSRNGAAQWKLLELQRRRERELEQARIAADGVVSRLMDDADQLRDEIEQLQEAREPLRSEVGRLWHVRAELRAAIEQEADAHGFDLVDEPDDDAGGDDDAALAQTAA